MRTIVMLVLLTLISGYEAAAQGQDREAMEDEMVREEVTETEEATNDFLGLEWGAGIGVMGSFGGDDAVTAASVDANNIVRIDEEGDMRPQLFLEMHVFLDPKARDWRWYQRQKAASRMARTANVKMQDADGDPIDPNPPSMPTPPLMGIGPFLALQSSDNEAIDALTLGLMWGIRRDPEKSASLNIGIGLSFDPDVQVLGGGLREGDPLPANETAVRYKKEGRFGWALMTSFTF